MRRIILVFVCLTCGGCGKHLQAGSGTLQVADALPGRARVKDTPGPWRALASLLLELNAAAAFSPVAPGALRASHCFDCRRATIVSTDKDDTTKAEVLKLKAEQAKLQAERAAVEAEILELQMQKLKAESPAAEESGVGEDSASQQGTSSAPPLSSIRVPGSIWPEGKNKKLHRFITKDDPTYQEIPGFMRTRENLVTSSTEGVYEGTYRVVFNLPGQENQPKTLELLQTTRGTPSFGAVRIQVETLVETIGPPEVYRIGDYIKDWTTDYDGSLKHNVIMNPNGVRAGGQFLRGDVIRAVSLPDPGVTQAKETEDAKKPWWEKINDSIGKAIVGTLPPSESDMVILDGTFNLAFEAAVKENLRVNGAVGAELVLVIERPDPAWLTYVGR
mmetsp:Transcript_36448/g.66315  ORF Transcript_36448/g.66315 Transcript_36448/m.66315 type:complete len:389 (+) Transcript_36448:107-1273(+)